MAAPVPLRPDFDVLALRALAKGSPDPVQTRRLLVLWAISTGSSGSETPPICEVGLQTVRDPWGPSAPERRAARGPQGAG